MTPLFHFSLGFFSSCSVKVLLCRNTSVYTIVFIFIFLETSIYLLLVCTLSKRRSDDKLQELFLFFHYVGPRHWTKVLRFGIWHKWTIKYWGGWLILSNIMFVRLIHLFAVVHCYYHIWSHCSTMLQFCCSVFETVSLHSPDYSRTK